MYVRKFKYTWLLPTFLLCLGVFSTSGVLGIAQGMAALSSLPESLNSLTSGDSETAQARIKIVDQSLSCPVCFERFRDPRLLECNHSFCRVCLESIVKKRRTDPEYPVGESDLSVNVATRMYQPKQIHIQFMCCMYVYTYLHI